MKIKAAPIVRASIKSPQILPFDPYTLTASAGFHNALGGKYLGLLQKYSLSIMALDLWAQTRRPMPCNID
jgi:hypothetical protein